MNCHGYSSYSSITERLYCYRFGLCSKENHNCFYKIFKTSLVFYSKLMIFSILRYVRIYGAHKSSKITNIPTFSNLHKIALQEHNILCARKQYSFRRNKYGHLLRYMSSSKYALDLTKSHIAA